MPFSFISAELWYSCRLRYRSNERVVVAGLAAAAPSFSELAAFLSGPPDRGKEQGEGAPPPER